MAVCTLAPAAWVSRSGVLAIGMLVLLPALLTVAISALVPEHAWQQLSCADGSKGTRVYDWALIGTASSDHRLLVRRSLHLNDKGDKELAFFLGYAPRGASLAELVAVRRRRLGDRDTPPVIPVK